MSNDLLQCFIPLFVAISVASVIPLFISLTEGVAVEERNSLITQATATALIVSLAFIFLGKQIFSFLGITSSDFRVGGGLVLLVLSISDLLFPPSKETQRAPSRQLGVVPIGIPLIIGPAALTTLMILADKHGTLTTTLGLALNLVIVWLAFRYSNFVLKIFGEGGTKAVAKVSSLLLTAIAVMMIRSGISTFIQGH